MRPRIAIFLSTWRHGLSTGTVSPSLRLAEMMEEQKLADSFTVVSLPAQADLARRGEFEAKSQERFTPPAQTEFCSAIIFTGDGAFRGPSIAAPFDPAGNRTEKLTIVTVAEPSQVQTDKEKDLKTPSVYGIGG